MLGLWSIGSAPIGMRLHIAFDMSLEDLLATADRLRAQGTSLSPLASQPTNRSSSDGRPRPRSYSVTQTATCPNTSPWGASRLQADRTIDCATNPPAKRPPDRGDPLRPNARPQAITSRIPSTRTGGLMLGSCR
jgi:hypothetical protein